MHTRKSLLFDHQEAWREKNNSSLFDVTMSSFDGAEVCELVGLYIIYILTNRFNNNDIGLYRDDGLAIFKIISPRKTDRIRKQLQNTLNKLMLKVTMQNNLKIVHFLDITFDLNTGRYDP